MRNIFLFILCLFLFNCCKKRDPIFELSDIAADMRNAKTVSGTKSEVDEFLKVADNYFHEICKKEDYYYFYPLAMQLQQVAFGDAKNENISGQELNEVREYYHNQMKEKFPALENLLFTGKGDCSLK